MRIILFFVMRYFYSLMCVKRAQGPSPPSWLIYYNWIFRKKSRQQEIADISRETLWGRRSEASKIKFKSDSSYSLCWLWRKINFPMRHLFVTNLLINQPELRWNYSAYTFNWKKLLQSNVTTQDYHVLVSPHISMRLPLTTLKSTWRETKRSFGYPDYVVF